MKESLLFTGGTGFLGQNCQPILKQRYEVTTCGISTSDDLKVDLANEIPTLPKHYDIVLHACGKAHVVPKTQEEIKAFYDINLQGTINLCKGLEIIGPPKSLIFISTMSVYGDVHGNMSTEETPLRRDTPYADSKIKAEEYLMKWCHDNNVILGILRPSLLAGENAPGNLGAMVRGIRTGAYFSINHGKAKKSILMAEDIANVIPYLAPKGGIYNICDNHNPTFGELEQIIAKQLGKKPPISIPLWLAKTLAKIGDYIHFLPLNSSRLEKIISEDTWSNEKIKRELDWTPKDVLSNYKI